MDETHGAYFSAENCAFDNSNRANARNKNINGRRNNKYSAALANGSQGPIEGPEREVWRLRKLGMAASTGGKESGSFEFHCPGLRFFFYFFLIL